MHPHGRLGTYRVGGECFLNRADAMRHASTTGGTVHWDFNEATYSAIDWSTPIETPLRELYRQRAQQLRDTYDFVSIFFSGGVDSTNVLHSFIDNGILVDEVVMYRPANSVHKANTVDRSNANIFSEIEYAAIPHLRQYLRDPRTSVRFIDLDTHVVDFLRDEQVMNQYRLSKNLNINYLSKVAMCMGDAVWRKLYLAGKKVCHIQGVDKPVINYREGQYSFQFNDNMLCNIYEPEFGSSEADMLGKGQFHEMFYWTPDFPQIVIKQCQVLKKLAQDNVLLRMLFASKQGVNESYLLPLLPHIYPPHVNSVRERFATEKISFMPGIPANRWFYEGVAPSVVGAFQDMVKQAKTNIDARFFNTGLDSLLVFKSPGYKI
jgi:hypothetical protein